MPNQSYPSLTLVAYKSAVNKKIYARLYRFLLCCIVILLVSACTQSIKINVNAISNPSLSAPGSRYFLINQREDVDDRDLYFLEFSRYFQYVLQKQGYTKTANKSDADIIIGFKFGISDGRTGITTHSWPIYENVGGETITITEKSTNSSGNPVTTTRTIRIPSRIERVGTSVETRSYTLFNKTAVLEARLNSKNDQPGEVLWMVTLSNVSNSDDLRSIMPYLAVAGSSFIGKNTGSQHQVSLEQKNPLLLELQATLK